MWCSSGPAAEAGEAQVREVPGFRRHREAPAEAEAEAEAPEAP
jgi:hypothetical protein